MIWLKTDKSKEYNFMLYRLQKTVTEIKGKKYLVRLNIFLKKY